MSRSERGWAQALKRFEKCMVSALGKRLRFGRSTVQRRKRPSSRVKAVERNFVAAVEVDFDETKRGWMKAKAQVGLLGSERSR